MTPTLKELYRTKIVPEMMKQFKYKSVMQVPKLVKISMNVGMGKAADNVKLIDAVVAELAAITGQHPVITRSKKDISNFKIRIGNPIGVMVTIRSDRMYEFLERYIKIALPRSKDFKGVPDKSFDGRGNYTMGIKEQIIFPEVDVDKTDQIHGMDITIVTTAKTDAEAKALLEYFGMPFKKQGA
ncbi:MAG: 50S ribosomal protein L5 [Candidatus Firestonebacteria bacterium RIFOXYA2_FULL_40_8]|nr:ribosomal protein L5 [uncultured bacterium]OGF51238.1 MAG: 50S ribosomal protein L5 [Candidatus Firestonebacteria bacterium RIFOXYA2_FULL_40_8]